MRAKVSGIELEMTHCGSSGLPRSSGCSAAYEIVCVSHQNCNDVELPNLRIITRLARVYLDSPIHEWWRDPYLVISFKGNLSREKRAAFLAAVTARTQVVAR